MSSFRKVLNLTKKFSKTFQKKLSVFCEKSKIFLLKLVKTHINMKKHMQPIFPIFIIQKYVQFLVPTIEWGINPKPPSPKENLSLNEYGGSIKIINKN